MGRWDPSTYISTVAFVGLRNINVLQNITLWGEDPPSDFWPEIHPVVLKSQGLFGPGTNQVEISVSTKSMAEDSNSFHCACSLPPSPFPLSHGVRMEIGLRKAEDLPPLQYSRAQQSNHLEKPFVICDSKTGCALVSLLYYM